MSQKYKSDITRVDTVKCEKCDSVHCFYTYNEKENMKEWQCDTCGHEWWTRC